MIITFIGHREVAEKPKIKMLLNTAIESLIKKGAEEFFLGGYGEFDIMAAHSVLFFKTKYPGIRSTIILPYPNKKYDKYLYTSSLYPPLETVPKKYAIIKRNEWMISHADMVIAYITHDWGGAARTYKYAKRLGKPIILLTDAV